MSKTRIGRMALAAFLGLTLAPPASAAARQDEAGAIDAYRSGRVSEAIRYWETELRNERATADQARRLVDALLRVGRSADAERIAREWVVGRPDGEELAARWGLALRRRGDRGGAREAWQRSRRSGAADALTADVQLGILDFESGRRQQAMATFDRFIDVYNDGSARTAEDLIAVATACVYLGIADPGLFQDAVRALEEAMATDPANPDARVMLAELFLGKYDSGEAADLLQGVLRADPGHPRALLAMARALQFDGQPGALELAVKAREADPELVEAMAFEGALLLQAERYVEATELAERALRIDGTALAALAVLAAAHFLRGDEEAYTTVVDRALAIDPAHGELHRTVAEAAVQNRLYEQAVELATEAVRLDPQLWSAWGTLGLNQLRIGAVEEGRDSLERAFAGDPYNVWIKNTLDLLDTWDAYDTIATDNTRLLLQRDTAGALRLLMAPLAEEAYTTLGAKYGVTMPAPVRVEVYRRHADFSVRTVGLAGLGALGVAFGPVVAMDAPAAPGMGEFNWGATLWHEMAHVATLTASGHRVPRWLTEGLSVYEEHRARPGWGASPDPGFLIAWLQGRLLPVSRISEGFVRPAYPEHIAHSYVQAALVCEWIDERFGFEAILDLLHLFRDGLTNDDAIVTALGGDLATVDADFASWVEQRYGGELEALRPASANQEAPHGDAMAAGPTMPLDPEGADPGDFIAQLRVGRWLADEGRSQEAVAYLERARSLVPGHAAPDSAYAYLARIHEDAGNLRRAADMLEQMVARNDAHAPAYERLADLYERMGESRRAAEALQRIDWIDPLQLPLQMRLGALWEALGEWQAAVRARALVVEMGPADRAEAWYRLALAYRGAGDAAQARRAVLRALETAPGYAAAQELLLQLRREGSS